MAITYTDDLAHLTPEHLEGFFVGWPDHPDPGTHLAILRASYCAWLALDGTRCVGFISALSDGLFYAYISLLEVLPDFQGQGIGSELVRRMLESLHGTYAIDLVCDLEVAGFYQGLGFQQAVGMIRRQRSQQRADVKR